MCSMPDVSPSKCGVHGRADKRRAIGAEIELELLAGCGFCAAWKRQVGARSGAVCEVCMR